MKVEDINAIESESGIIASLIHNPEYSFYSEELLPNHFTNKDNRCVYTAICQLARRGIKNVDPYNIIEILNSEGATKNYAENITVEKLQELVDYSDVIARYSVEEYKLLVSNVLNAAFRRDTYSKLKECETLCFDKDTDDLERKIYKELDEVMLEFNVGTEMPEFKDVIDDIWTEIEARQRGETTAIEFPFEILNKYVVMEPGETICFSAPQKAGKSAMLLTCAVDLLKKDKSVLYIDSEISTKLFSMRLIAHLTGIKFGKIRSGDYQEEDVKKIQEAIEWIKTRKFIHIYMPVLDENAMYLAAKKAKHLTDIDCIIVDYLKADSSSDDAYAVYSSLGRVSDTLKNKIAGDMGICSITAAQATSTGKIADSAKIARNVSTVISVTDKTIEELELDQTNASKKLRVLFNRNGAQMQENEWIDMCFDGSTCKYWESPVQHEEINPF